MFIRKCVISKLFKELTTFMLVEKFITEPHESIADLPPNYLSTPFSCRTFIYVCFLQKHHSSCSSEKFVRFFPSIRARYILRLSHYS